MVLVLLVGFLLCLPHSAGRSAYRSSKGRVAGPEGAAELGVSRPPLGESGNRLVMGTKRSGTPGTASAMRQAQRSDNSLTSSSRRKADRSLTRLAQPWRTVIRRDCPWPPTGSGRDSYTAGWGMRSPTRWLSLQLGDPTVLEPDVGAGRREPFLKGSVVPSQFPDPLPRRGVLDDDPLDGPRGDLLLGGLEPVLGSGLSRTLRW